MPYLIRVHVSATQREYLDAKKRDAGLKFAEIMRRGLDLYMAMDARAKKKGGKS